jgi:hypothetical protein
MDPFAINKFNVTAKNKDGLGAYYILLVIAAKFIKLLVPKKFCFLEFLANIRPLMRPYQFYDAFYDTIITIFIIGCRFPAS